MTGFTDEQVYDVAAQVGCTFETARAVMEATPMPAFTDDQISEIHARLEPTATGVWRSDMIRQILTVAAEVR